MEFSKRAAFLFSTAIVFATYLHADEMAKSQPATYQPYYYGKDTEEFFAYADYLYWQPFTEDSLTWGQGTSKKQVLNYEWDSGFRVGIGYRLPQNAWDNFIRPWQVEAKYTHYVTDAEGHVNGGVSPRIPIFPVTSHTPTADFSFDSGKSNSSLHYKRVDAVAAWPIWMNPNVILRLMMGGSGVWLKETWHTSFTKTGDTQNTRLDWDYSSGGLLGGADIYLAIGKGLGFFADASALFLFGSAEDKEKYTQNLAGVTSQSKFHKTFNAFKQVYNLAGGIDYKHWFGHSCMLRLALAYEITWMANMNQVGRLELDEASVPGLLFTRAPIDMGLQGLVATLGLDF